MNVYIFRHGIAEEMNLKGDSARALTDRGTVKVEQMARMLSRAMKPVVFLSSPYVRAVQTAEIVADVFGVSHDDIHKADALFPGSEIEETIIEINAHADGRDIILFGHNPHMSELVSALVSDSRAYITMKKASCARVRFHADVRAGEGELVWLAAPALLAEV